MSGGMHVGRARAALDVGVQVVGRALNLIPGVVVTVLLARTLGDDSFGQWSTALAVVQIGATVGDFGLEQVAVRKAAAERGREHEWIGALFTLRLTIAVPVTLGAALVQLLLADSATMGATGLLLCGTLLIAPFSVTRTTFQLRVRNDLSVLVMTVNSLLWTAAVVAIALGDAGMVAFAAAFLAAAFLSTLLEVWLALRMSRPQLRRSTALWRELGAHRRAGRARGAARDGLREAGPDTAVRAGRRRGRGPLRRGLPDPRPGAVRADRAHDHGLSHHGRGVARRPVGRSAASAS